MGTLRRITTGIARQFTTRESRKALLGYDEVFQDIMQRASSKSGVPITTRTALQATTALSCVKVLAEGTAQVPCKLFRERGNGKGKDPARDLDLYDVLYRQPNDVQTAFDFMEQRTLHLALEGGAYAYKVKLGDRVLQLLPYEPQQVQVLRKGWEIRFQITTIEGRQLTLGPDEVWYTRGLSWDGVRGLEGVKLAREAIGLAIATEDHGSKLFRNHAQPGGLLTTEQALTKEQRKDLRESWDETHGGSEKKFKTSVLWGGMKWQPLSAPNDESQFLETRRFQVEEVCRAFRVMPIMVGHADKSQTYASAEQMFLAHIVHTMMPWYTRLEQSIDVFLLSKNQRKEGVYSKFILNALMRGTARDRAQFYKDMYGIASLSPNEIRDLEDMNPYEGGDEYRAPMNMDEPGASSSDDIKPNEEGKKYATH